MRAVLPNELVAGPALYEVVEIHQHTTLLVGDVVVLCVDPKNNTWLVRVHDFTIHHLSDFENQLVHLKPYMPPRRPTKAKPGFTGTKPNDLCAKCCAEGLRTTDEYMAGRTLTGDKVPSPNAPRSATPEDAR